MGGIYALLALGLNLQYGYTGLINFGVVAFFAIGAYASALLVAARAFPTRSALPPPRCWPRWPRGRSA